MDQTEFSTAALPDQNGSAVVGCQFETDTEILVLDDEDTNHKRKFTECLADTFSIKVCVAVHLGLLFFIGLTVWHKDRIFGIK